MAAAIVESVEVSQPTISRVCKQFVEEGLEAPLNRRAPRRVYQRKLDILSRQCLDRRLPDFASLEAEVAAWQTQRSAAASTVDWRFTTADARIELKRLYPSLQE